MTDQELQTLREVAAEIDQVLEDLEERTEWYRLVPNFLEYQVRLELACHELQLLDPAHDRATCYRTGSCYWTTRDDEERGRYEAQASQWRQEVQHAAIAPTID